MLDTFELLCNKIELLKGTTNFSIRRLFALNDTIINDNNTSFVIEVQEDIQDITAGILTRLLMDDVSQYPPILIASINRPPQDHSKKIVYETITINNKHKYKLFSITAYNNNHFAQFTKKEDEEDGSWIGMDDETCFDITSEMISYLYGWDDSNNPCGRCLNRDWLAYALFYHKSDYSLSEKNIN